MKKKEAKWLKENAPKFIEIKKTKEGHSLGKIDGIKYLRSKNKKNYILGW